MIYLAMDKSKIQCNNCGREIMMDRLEFNRKLKKVLGDKNEQN